MLELLVNNSTANTKVFQRFIADIPDDKLCAQFPGLPNHAAWQIGHLTAVRGAVSNMLGKPAPLPEDWSARYGRNSTPNPDPAVNPPRELLLSLLEKTQSHLTTVLRETDPASLDAPHDRPQMLPLFPTKKHLFFHILTTHDGLHLGQLSDLRRTMGLPRIL